MKISKIIIPICLVAGLVLSWGIFLTGELKTHNEYNNIISTAQSNVENGLYEQAIEKYKLSLAYKNSVDTYYKIKDVYDVFYTEEDTADVRNAFIADMQEATTYYPEESVFWTSQVTLYMKALNYTKAFESVRNGINRGAQGDDIMNLYYELKYMTKLDFKTYDDYRTANNGYTSVLDGDKWFLLDSNGNVISNGYERIYTLNADGYGIIVNDIDARLIDNKGVARARFDKTFEETGCFDTNSGIIPVKIDGKWTYMNMDGELLFGDFEKAGSFNNGKAMAYKNGEWFLLKTDGEETSLSQFEDIKLNCDGSYMKNSVLIAKEHGSYHLYNNNLEKIGDFSAENIDVNTGTGLIAFKSGGKWGFVNTKGEVVIEPTYANAKSFSNSYAAVADEDGLWGFITTDNNLVVDYQYLSTEYFTVGEKCLVSDEENCFNVLEFKLS